MKLGELQTLIVHFLRLSMNIFNALIMIEKVSLLQI